MNDIELKSVVMRNDSVESSYLDDEAVMMNVETGDYFNFNEVGTRIWSLLKKEITVEDICEIIYREFEVNIDDCINDVQIFLNRIKEQGLITVKN